MRGDEGKDGMKWRIQQSAVNTARTATDDGRGMWASCTNMRHDGLDNAVLGRESEEGHR